MAGHGNNGRGEVGSGTGRQDAETEPSSLPSRLRQLQRNIEEAVSRDSVCQIAAKTGIGVRRVLQIIAGAAPDGYELRLLETAYRTALWPRFHPTESSGSQ